MNLDDRTSPSEQDAAGSNHSARLRQDTHTNTPHLQSSSLRRERLSTRYRGVYPARALDAESWLQKSRTLLDQSHRSIRVPSLMRRALRKKQKPANRTGETHRDRPFLIVEAMVDSERPIDLCHVYGPNCEPNEEAGKLLPETLPARARGHVRRSPRILIPLKYNAWSLMTNRK